MKSILSKKKKHDEPKPEDTSPHGGIDSISIDDLEAPAEKPEEKPSGEAGAAREPKPAEPAAAKMPGKALPAKKPSKHGPKISDQDKSRALGIAATAVCAGGLAIFVLYQMFAGIPKDPGDRATLDPPGTPAQSESPQVPGIAGAAGELEFEAPGNQAGQDAPSGGSVYNRGQWDDYKLADEDGNQAARSPSDALEGGTRYWVRDRKGNNAFKIVIPAGFVAGDMGDCVTVGTGDYAATGNEPLTFFWRDDTETRLLLERGYCDLAGNATGYDQYDVRALGYYLFRDEMGQDWPVVTAIMTRDESNPDIDTYSEYRIVVGKPSADGRWLAGAIPTDSFASISSGLYPNISALAMGMFPASSVPDFPAYWEIPPLGGSGQAQAADQPQSDGDAPGMADPGAQAGNGTQGPGTGPDAGTAPSGGTQAGTENGPDASN